MFNFFFQVLKAIFHLLQILSQKGNKTIFSLKTSLLFGLLVINMLTFSQNLGS
jgi:hypothetical protein